MINHSIQTLSLAETDDGEVALPTELSGLVNFPTNLRHFILLTRRGFNASILESIASEEGIKIKYHDDEAPDYFGLTLKFKPIIGSNADFVEDNGETFFNHLIAVVGNSSKRGISGKRAVFIREFRRVYDPNHGEVMETKIVVSTNIFYNDYRVTVGFPSNTEEVESVTESIYNELENQWSDSLKLELEFVELQEEELDSSF